MLDVQQAVRAEAPGVAVPTDVDETSGVAFKQFSFRELTIQRYLAHPVAKWATLALALIFVLCYGAPLWHALFPNFIQATTQYTLQDASTGPSLRHLFGTDSYNGHDIFSLVLWGGQISLLIGLGSMLLAICIAIVFGSFAGYFGGLLDTLLMRITDINYSVPILLTVPLATRVFGHSDPFSIAIIFGLFSWAGPARIVRSQFLSLREQQFAEAARALGVSGFRIIFRHLLPNAVGPILVSFTLGIATNIVLEAFVSFLGFGIQPPTYSWGATMSGAQGTITAGNWWWITFPGLAVVATVICINFIGDGLRDALDPKIVN